MMINKEMKEKTKHEGFPALLYTTSSPYNPSHCLPRSIPHSIPHSIPRNIPHSIPHSIPRSISRDTPHYPTLHPT